MSTATIQERVAKGAAWLDEVHPGWRDQINLDKLELSDGCRCVCGQVFGGYGVGTDILRGEVAYSSDRYFDLVIGHGFLCDPDDHGIDSFDGYLALTAEWRRVIHASRVPAEVVPA